MSRISLPPRRLGSHLPLRLRRRPARQAKRKPHRTPNGIECKGEGFYRTHLGYEFHSSAARLRFAGTGWGYPDSPPWRSLLADPDDRRKALLAAHARVANRARGETSAR